MSARKADEILREARDELVGRKQRLEQIISQGTAELSEVRKALRRLGSHANGKPITHVPAGEGKSAQSSKVQLDREERRQRVLKVLDEAANEEPLSPQEIAKRADVSIHGLGNMLKLFKAQSKVAEPEEGRWLSTKSPRFETAREAA